MKTVKVLENKAGSGSVTYRITIPQDIVRELGLKKGDELELNCKFGVVRLTKVTSPSKN